MFKQFQLKYLLMTHTQNKSAGMFCNEDLEPLIA